MTKPVSLFFPKKPIKNLIAKRPAKKLQKKPNSKMWVEIVVRLSNEEIP